MRLDEALPDANGVEVVPAHDMKTRESVVIRRVQVERFERHQAFQFKNQLRMMAEVESEFFSTPLDWGELDGQLFSVQPELSIPTLGEYLLHQSSGDSNQIGHPKVFELARLIARALQDIHAKGCTLGTVQPEHVYYDGTEFLINCPGPGQFLRQSNGLAELQFVRYASPELLGAIGEDVGPASDLYSLGILLYRVLAGRVPFESENAGDIIFQHLTQEPDFECLSEIPEALQKIVSYLLSKEPQQRYQSAHAVAHDFNQLAQAISNGKPLSSIVMRRADTRSTIQDPQLVGRKEEIESLGQLLDQTRNGEAKTAAVIGVSGIGKTRLVTEMLREATRKGFVIFQGRASDQADQQPMDAILQIVSQLTRAAESDPEIAQRIKKELKGYQYEVATIAPQLGELLGWSETLVGPRELGAGRVNKTLAKILSLLGNDQPVLIWVDDCHWLDVRSLDILESLQLSPHQFLVLTLRPEEGIAPEVLERMDIHSEYRLAQLKEAEVRALVESMAGNLPDEIVQTVNSLSVGSPFMASAILRGIAESGGMEFRKGQWRSVPEKLADIQASSSAAEALLNRLEKVPEEILSQLSIAAVIGKEFNTQTLVELSKVTYEKTQSNFEWCRKQRLVWAKHSGQLAFVHDSIRETLIRYLSNQRRMELHRELAELLQRSDPHRKFAIAHHFAAAGDNQKALPYALAAAKKAQDQFSLDAAKRLLEIAYAGVDIRDDRSKYEIESGLADVSMLDAAYDEADLWYQKASLSAYDPTTKARTSMKRGELEFKRGNKENAVTFCEIAVDELGMTIPKGRVKFGIALVGQVLTQTAHSIAPSWMVGRRGTITEAERIYCTVMGQLAYGYWFTQSKYRLLWAHLSHLNTAEKFEPTDLLGQAYSDHAPAMTLLPWNSRAIQYAKKSLKIRKQLNDVWGQGQTRHFYSIALYSDSRFTECIDQACRAEEILSRTGDQWEVNVARYQKAASLYRLGDLSSALRLTRRTYEFSKEVGDYQSTGNALDIWARAGLGPIPQEFLDLERSRELRDCQGECQVNLAAGVNSVWKKDYSHAIECFQASIDCSNEAGVCNTYITPNYPWLVTAMRLDFESKYMMSRKAVSQKTGELLAAAKRAVRKVRLFRNDLPHALRELGAAYALHGKHRKVRQTLEASLLEAEKQGAKYEAALTRKMMGEIGSEMNWSDAAELTQQAQQDLDAIREPVLQQRQETSLSLLDRFDSLLTAGRVISVSVNHPEIFQETIKASEKLLRGQRTFLLMADQLSEASQQDFTFDVELCRKAMRTGGTLVSDVEVYDEDGQSIHNSGAFLCSPIVVKDEVIACLYVANDYLKGLFGDDEIRIAEYLTSAAGAALEKSRGFQELAELNQTLEQRVRDRTNLIEARSEELEATANQLILAQEELELARDAAESANEAKSDFLARMSHEIRTPISAVLGFTELMLRGVVRDPAQQREKLSTIHASGKHLLQLINDLLDISKIESGKMDVESISCEPGKLVHDVLQSLEGKALEKSVDLNLQIKGTIPQTIQSDPTRLRQVLTNLIGNAIKFTRKGEVEVTLSAQRDGKFQFEIADTGIGMTEKQIQKIFDPFTQADSSTTRKYGGTGLGLSISKRLAEALGGGITVESEIAKGSTFTIAVEMGLVDDMTWLDAMSFQELIQQASNDQWNPVNLDGLCALIVDDSETNRDLLSIVLQEAGVEIAQVENGLLACDLLMKRGHEFDVVLMDMQMPVLDGYEATRRLRESGFEKPIFALTANSMKGDAAKCLSAGCTDYVSKPIDFGVLLGKLNKLDFEPKEPGQDVIEEESETQLPWEPAASNQVQEIHEDLSLLYQGFELPENEPFRSLSCRFVDKVFDRLDEFTTAYQTDDFEKLANLAHWVKGTGGTVGLNEISEVADRLERSSKALKRDESEKCLNDLLSLFPDS